MSADKIIDGRAWIALALRFAHEAAGEGLAALTRKEIDATALGDTLANLHNAIEQLGEAQRMMRQARLVIEQVPPDGR